MNIDIKGYNIYMEGPTGIGKTIYAKNYLNKAAQNKPVPDDWCYIFLVSSLTLNLTYGLN